MNDCSVGTGSPLHPPIAITDVPDETSSAAADCEPLVAADHSVCVLAKTPARSGLAAPHRPSSCRAGRRPSSAPSGSSRGAAWRRWRSRRPLCHRLRPAPRRWLRLRRPCAEPSPSTATAAAIATAVSVHGKPWRAKVVAMQKYCRPGGGERDHRGKHDAAVPAGPISPRPHRADADQPGDGGRHRDGVVRVDHAAHVAEHQLRSPAASP